MPVGTALVAAFLEVIYTVLNFYIWVIIIGAALSWLVAFEIVNSYNRVVHVVGDLTTRNHGTFAGPNPAGDPCRGRVGSVTAGADFHYLFHPILHQAFGYLACP